MNPLKLETRELEPGIYGLSIGGSLDWSNAARVDAAIQDIFGKGVYRLAVNLQGTRYVSSSGFGCFIAAIDVATKHSGDLVFTAAPPEIRDVFNILGLTKILRFADDDAGAVEQLKKLVPSP